MRNVEFINAGAGSGKTFSLVSVLTQFLEDTSHHPSQVILTTFTELAAAEFREKAREALLRKGLFDQASQLETAAIGTVHSVAYSFVQKYWYLLGRGPASNVISDSDKLFFINQSLANLATPGDNQFFDFLFRVFNFSTFDDHKSEDDPDFWQTHLRCIIEKMEQYEITDLQLSVQKSLEQIDLIFNRNVSLEPAYTIQVLKEYLAICTSKVNRKTVEELLKGDITYCSYIKLISIDFSNRDRTNLPALDRLLFTAGEIIRSKQFGDHLKKYIRRIFELASIWKDQFKAYKTLNRLIDYNDMESLFLELISMESVAQVIRNSYKLILVDEFQDSSPMQLKIFDRLSELIPHSIWVGDPKQAIYGFRGSDALLIKAITGVFNMGDKEKNIRMGKPLDTSYRSRAELVNLANEVFTRAFADIPAAQVKLKVKRNDAVEFQDNFDDEIVHWHFKASTSKGNKQEHYQSLAHQVQLLLNSDKTVYDKETQALRRVQPEDIAILCRRKQEVNEIASFLQKTGIATSGQTKDDAYANAAEFSLVRALLNYTLNPRNEYARAEILHLTDPETWSVANIIKSRMQYVTDHLQVGDNETEEVFWETGNPFIRNLEGIIEDIKSLPVPDLVENLIIRLDLRSVVSMYGNVARRRKNLDNLIRQAKDYDARCLLLGLGSSLNNFIVFLDSCEEVDEKAEKVKGAVNVITYHKSKGLEWNIVILESLDYDELEDNALIRKTFFGVNDIIVSKPSALNLFPERYIQVLPWFAGTKRNLPDDIKNDILVNKVFGFLRDKTSEEVKRLMYVGVTRARDFLITTSYNNCELSWLTNIGCNPVVPDDHTSPTIDIWSAALQVASQRIDPIDETDEVEITEDLTIWVHPEKSLNYRHPRYLNPSKTFEELNIEVLLLQSFNQRITIRNDNNDGEKFTDDQVGTALHNIFCIFQPDNRELTGKINTLLATGHMLSVFPHPEEIIRSAQNLYDFLNNTWPGCQKVYKELPVQQRTEEGQIIRGSCDLVWETDTGFVLVDYKSYPGPLPSVLNLGLHYAGNYARQLNTYKRVLEKTGKPVLATLIYYLVSGNIVEVKTSNLLPQQNIIERSADPDNIVCWEEYENLSTLGWISTGIENVILYVGPHPNGSYRIRVSNIPNKHAREDCFTITIPDLAIIGTVNKSFITDEIMEKIKEFVQLNMDPIRTYSDWDITTDKFLDLLKPVGSQ